MSEPEVKEVRCNHCGKLLLRMRSKSGETWIEIICSRCKRVNQLDAA